MIVAQLALGALLVVVAPTQAWWFQAPEPTKAVASFDMDGVQGRITFEQAGPNAPTQVTYDLQGLKDNNQLYHVHVKPVPPFDPSLRSNLTAIKELCGGPTTGGHLNPHAIKQQLPPKSAPFDHYEVGDLAGKHGPLAKVPGAGDRYQGTFTDDKLPMTGENGIVGRSIVIHKNNKDRWVCATIQEQK